MTGLAQTRVGIVVAALVASYSALPGRHPSGSGLPAERGQEVQTTVGSIAGCAMDSSGGTLPGVTVTADRAGSGRQAVTDARGCYQFENLEAGDYTVEARLSGFRTMTRSGVVVRPGETTHVDLWLCLAGVMEHVWVVPRSYEDLVRSAEAVIHVRITATRLEHDCENPWIHTARVLHVVKPTAGLRSHSIEFFQFRSTAERTPYRVGTELVMALWLGRGGTPGQRTAGPYGVYYVTGGRVTRARDWGTTRYDDMKLDNFLAALHELVK